MELIYDTGRVKLYHGDARALTAIPDASVALVVTSPPYWNARDYATWPSYAAYLDDMAAAWRECFRVLDDGGRIAVNVPLGYGRPASGGYLPIECDTTSALVAAGFEPRGHVVWDKGDGVAGTAWGSWRSPSNPCLRDIHEVVVVAHKGRPARPGGAATIDAETFTAATRSIWRIPPITNHWHPAPFPAEIPRRLIELLTCAGEVVLDPFGGSMTTAFTAEKCGRVGIGVDLCREYVEHAAGPLFCLANL